MAKSRINVKLFLYLEMRHISIWGIFKIGLLICLPNSLISQNSETNQHYSFTKGRIEWLVPEGLTSETPIIQTAFSISESALDELEKNLIYKTSDRIHLIAFTDYANYYEFIRNRHALSYLKEPFYEITNSGNVYHPIIITGNTIDIEYQIRKATAIQFLDEFLLGFTYRNRFEAIENQNTPQWLKNGFIEYFAAGINREDFIQFKAQLKTKSFRNLNFIASEHQVLFGKVLWYFFEKEKGRNLNSVFWTLIKYADNFENSFEYHFGIPFRDWLDIRVNELQKPTPFISKSSDAQFPLPLSETQRTKVYHDRLGESIIVTSIEREKETSYLWEPGKARRTKFFEKQWGFEQPFPKFLETSWSYNAHSKSWHFVYFNGEWKLKVGEQELSLGNAANFKLIKSIHDTAILVKEEINATYLEYFSISTGIKLSQVVLETNGAKIEDFILLNERLYASRTQKTETSYKTDLGYWKFSVPDQFIVFYSIDIENGQSAPQNIVIENNDRFSFVINSTTEDAVYHIDKSSNGFGNNMEILKTPTKGMSYQQTEIDNHERFAEFFIHDNKWNLNYIELSAPVYNRDTFIKVPMSFDTTHSIIDSLQQHKKYPENHKFTAPFKRRELPKTTIITPSIKKEWTRFTFNPWFYLHSSRFYMSNEDFKTPYDGRVSVKESYNSPLTFFLKNSLLDVSNYHRLDLNLFSNINRRRLGFQLDYKFNKNEWSTHYAKFTYRLRQYAEDENTNFRNRSSELEYRLDYKKGDWISYTGARVLNSQIIALNNSREKVNIATKMRWLWETPMGIYKYTKTSNKAIQNIEIITDNKITIGFISYENSINPTAGIESNLGVKGRLFLFETKSNLAAKYSFTEQNTSYLLGGTTGWISQSANSNVIYNRLRPHQQQFIANVMSIRGLPVGIRMGNSFVHMQHELGLPLLRLFPKSLKERIFWRSIVLYGFWDIGLAFYGSSPAHYSNPYNTKIITTPNYTLSASTKQNPWVSGNGIGAQMNILGYPIRLEYAQGRLGGSKSSPRLLLSLGKNF